MKPAHCLPSPSRTVCLLGKRAPRVPLCKYTLSMGYCTPPGVSICCPPGRARAQTGMVRGGDWRNYPWLASRAPIPQLHAPNRAPGRVSSCCVSFPKVLLQRCWPGWPAQAASTCGHAPSTRGLVRLARHCILPAWVRRRLPHVHPALLLWALPPCLSSDLLRRSYRQVISCHHEKPPWATCACAFGNEPTVSDMAPTQLSAWGRSRRRAFCIRCVVSLTPDNGDESLRCLVLVRCRGTLSTRAAASTR